MRSEVNGYVGLISLLLVILLIALAAAYFVGDFGLARPVTPGQSDSLLQAPIHKAQDAAQKLQRADQQHTQEVEKILGP